jgi:hypothetical protein
MRFNEVTTSRLSHTHGGFQVKLSFAKCIGAREKQILKRLATARENRFSRGISNPNPVLATNSVKYELADRTHAISYAGVSAMLKLSGHVGLTDAINHRVQLLKSHAPYHESDHVLAMIMNVLCNGSRLEHLERLRNDSTFLDAIGADSIPDPTTAGDFCRRFHQSDIDSLMQAINEARINVWRQQDDAFFDQALIDVDGVIVATTAEFEYQPNACEKTYRMVVVRKNVSKEQGDVRLIDEIRYFFYIATICPRYRARALFLAAMTDATKKI